MHNNLSFDTSLHETTLILRGLASLYSSQRSSGDHWMKDMILTHYDYDIDIIFIYTDPIKSLSIWQGLVSFWFYSPFGALSQSDEAFHLQIHFPVSSWPAVWSDCIWQPAQSVSALGASHEAVSILGRSTLYRDWLQFLLNDSDFSAVELSKTCDFERDVCLTARHVWNFEPVYCILL